MKTGGTSTTRQKPSVAFECLTVVDLIVSIFALSYPWVYVSKYSGWRSWIKKCFSSHYCNIDSCDSA